MNQPDPKKPEHEQPEETDETTQDDPERDPASNGDVPQGAQYGSDENQDK